jgi:hypothetical protein
VLGVHEAAGSKPAILTIWRGVASPIPFEPTAVGYHPHHAKVKIAADARKRGDPGNRFIGNIPTANPCSILPGKTWFSTH